MRRDKHCRPKGTQLDLGHGQPAAVLGRVIDL